MADGGAPKVPIWVWGIVAVLVILWLMNKAQQKVQQTINSVTPGQAATAGLAAAAPGAGQALGSFLVGLVSGGSSSSSSSSNSSFKPDQSDATYEAGETFEDYATGLFGPGTYS